jgi:hypothetical protein
MGVDFIRRQSGRPYRKRWAKGIDRMKEPSFLDVGFGVESQFVTLFRCGAGALNSGQELLVQKEQDGSCTAYDGLEAVARIEAPPSALLHLIRDNCGLAPVTIDDVGALGQTIEVRLP